VSTAREPIKKTLKNLPLEDAHGGSGQRQLIFQKSEPFVSSCFEAMTKGFLPAGSSYEWHTHDGIDELFIVVSGIGFIEYENGVRFDFQEGDVLYSPADLSHRIQNTGETTSEFFFIRIAS